MSNFQAMHGDGGKGARWGTMHSSLRDQPVWRSPQELRKREACRGSGARKGAVKLGLAGPRWEGTESPVAAF